MVNIHGLIRSKNVEFGRDADTGGQTRYVIDMVSGLSDESSVSRIDLVTRLIKDKRVSSDYSIENEKINGKAQIIRLPCGGGKYLHKEKLWSHLEEFSDHLISYIRSDKRIPDAVHGHYADGGFVAMRIAETFGIPLIFTAHSLGRNKLSFLKSCGWSEEKADKIYNIRTRIEAEEEILNRSELVIASTKYEKDQLYGAYRRKNDPSYSIIPPGIDLDVFFPYYHYEIPGSTISEETKQAHMRVQNELKRFHFEPDKPLIVSLCRPDARKNIDLLIDVYGKDKELQSMANLAIFAGIRDDISLMEVEEQQVLTEILLAMDKYDLYGKMAIPKYHDANRDVPELYRITALKRGVFVSASFLETFGLTFIEASASGLPFIATDKGGPVDIENNCHSGELVDIENPETISAAIKKIISDNSYWNELSENGANQTRKVYTWKHHCSSYIKEMTKVLRNRNETPADWRKEFGAVGKRINQLNDLLIVDIDDTLIGDDEATETLRHFLKERRNSLGFGVATGRNIESARKLLLKYGFDDVDIYISSAGSEIYYGSKLHQDKGWHSHISRKWKPDSIRDALSSLSFISLQKAEGAQREYKISYNLDNARESKELIPIIHNTLSRHNLSYTLLFSHGSYVDILPFRASKGRAVSYLSGKWQIEGSHIVTAGNSGNDRDMLTCRVRGVVVSNYSQEIESLRKNKSVYFADKPYASGILEGLKYWQKK